jgi:hypothetical protein
MNDSLKSRVHFTKTLDDLTEFIAPENIPADLGGPDAYNYRYIEPDTNDKAETLSNETYSPTREFLQGQRQRIASEMLDATRLWLQTSAMRDRIGTALQHDRRVELIEELRLNYWRLDPFVRARTHLDREGVIVGDGVGSVNIYPHRVAILDDMAEESDGSASATSSLTASLPNGHDHRHSVQSVQSGNNDGFDFALTSHLSDDTETESSMSMRDSFMREYDDSMISEDMISEVDELPAVVQQQQQQQQQITQHTTPAHSETHIPSEEPSTHSQPESYSQDEEMSDFDDDDFDDDEDVEIHDAVTHMVGGRGSGIVQRAAVRVVNV